MCEEKKGVCGVIEWIIRVMCVWLFMVDAYECIIEFLMKYVLILKVLSLLKFA